RGPARLCQALGIGRAQNGADVCDLRGPLRLLAPAGFSGLPETLVRSGPRGGVRVGAEEEWRFWGAGDPAVSAYRPHVPRRRPAAAAASDARATDVRAIDEGATDGTVTDGTVTDVTAAPVDGSMQR